MKVINLDRIVGESLSGEIYTIDHVFNDNGRMGSVGGVYRPVLIEEYESATSDVGLQRHLARWWQDARRRGDVRGIGEYASDLYAEKGLRAIWDVVGEPQASRLREYGGLSVEAAPIYTCCGGGMCIDRRIGWRRVVDAGTLFHLLDLDRGRAEAWEYFVNCGSHA